MTREDIKYWLYYYGMSKEFVDNCAEQIERDFKKVSELPEGLEEAAEEQGKTKFYTRADNFKAGAEWMAGQGVTIEDVVCELYNELYLYYIDDCSSMTPDTSCEMLKELGVSNGDKVVVQIRKKEDEK